VHQSLPALLTCDCTLICSELPARIGDVLTPEQYAMVEELGIMVDRSGEGTLLQARFSSVAAVVKQDQSVT
jgi:hypothetical protein